MERRTVGSPLELGVECDNATQGTRIITYLYIRSAPALSDGVACEELEARDRGVQLRCRVTKYIRVGRGHVGDNRGGDAEARVLVARC